MTSRLRSRKPDTGLQLSLYDMHFLEGEAVSLQPLYGVSQKDTDEENPLNEQSHLMDSEEIHHATSYKFPHL